MQLFMVIVSTTCASPILRGPFDEAGADAEVKSATLHYTSKCYRQVDGGTSAVYLTKDAEVVEIYTVEANV